MLVPSDDAPRALQVLERLVVTGADIRIAAAFVTSSGVRALAGLVSGHEGISLEVVARAADATEPEALLALRDELGAQVRVVIGQGAQQFHPKLWLIDDGSQVHVLSGSGNLTRGGLELNDEQFELRTVARIGHDVDAEVERFERLTQNAYALSDVEGSAIWSEWLAVRKRQAQLLRQVDDLARNLNVREFKPPRTADRAQLSADLRTLYDDIVAARLPRRDGARYVPSRFLQGIRRAEESGDPVPMVTRICRLQTDGFNVVLEADLPELSVESLVVDIAKPYHDLFEPETKRLAAERLQKFPSWNG